MKTDEQLGREIIQAMIDLGEPSPDFRIACQVTTNRGMPYEWVERFFYDIRRWLDYSGGPSGMIKTESRNGHTIYSVDVLQRLAFEAR